jgi:hypothetical protein
MYTLVCIYSFVKPRNVKNRISLYGQFDFFGMFISYTCDPHFILQMKNLVNTKIQPNGPKKILFLV